FLRALLRLQHHGEVAQGVVMLRAAFQRLAVAGFRLAQAATFLVDVAEVVVRVRVLRRDLQRGADQLHALVAASALMAQHAQVMQRIGLRHAQVQHLAVQPLGGVEIVGLVCLHRLLQQGAPVRRRRARGRRTDDNLRRVAVHAPAHAISTVKQPSTMVPPCAQESPSRAAGWPPISTVGEPMTMLSGGPTHTAMSPKRAAGKPPISTVGAPGAEIGPPTCGTGPVVIGQTCMSVRRAAGCMVNPLRSDTAQRKLLSMLPTLNVVRSGRWIGTPLMTNGELCTRSAARSCTG